MMMECRGVAQEGEAGGVHIEPAQYGPENCVYGRQ